MLAQPPPDGPEVDLHGHVDQRAVDRGELGQLEHVELVGEQVLVLGHARAQLPAREHHVHARERLAHLEPVVRAHLEAERYELAHRAHLRGERLVDEPLVRRIWGELCRAVAWMHSVGLVHRDIKLESTSLPPPPLPRFPSSC